MQKLIIDTNVIVSSLIQTGNTTDFTFSSYKHTQIVTPKEYWLIYEH